MAKCINCIPFIHPATCLFAHQDFRTIQEQQKWLTTLRVGITAVCIPQGINVCTKAY